ncbi:MAG: hypothetical protein QM781_15435 [Chitinophagaceae bacterium]
MGDFKVVEVVNATTIKVSPQWTFPRADGTPLISNLIKISGLDLPDTSEWVIDRLNILLQDREIDAYSPSITVNHMAPIECRVFLSGTDIVYYFPEHEPARDALKKRYA